MGSECSTLVKAMRDVDVFACQIARAKGFAAAMIDAAMRKRFELMVAELHRKLDAIEEHPVCQRENDKKGRRATAWPCDRARLAHLACVSTRCSTTRSRFRIRNPISRNRQGTLVPLAD
jgi:predicted phage gp36 major capsid-like protein